MSLGSLKSIAAKVETAPARARAEVDISEFVGAETGAAVLTFEEPDLPRLFAVPADAKRLKRVYPEWPASLRSVVCLLGISLVAPLADGDNPAEFFCHVANNNRALWGHIIKEFRAAFPNIADPDEDEDEGEG